MGVGLSRPVESVLVERHETKGFRVGVAEMNGWRNSMEDTHLVLLRPGWGVFGVFDGHGGQACSAFVARRLREELEANGSPADDKEIRNLMFRVDDEFLKTGQASGSTATMVAVNTEPNGKQRLRVINAGDSRTLLGRRNGQIRDGGGTDEGMTTDHKPENAVERERIYRTGGTVQRGMGPARVNGDLAVSRAFGDKDHKRTGGPGPEDRPVTVDPEIKHAECEGEDFLMLVCDGVSEGNFTNAQAVKVCADVLRQGNDPGAAARAVIEKALATNSHDNISCMVVCFDGVEAQSALEFVPGPVYCKQRGFVLAYEAMCERAGRTLKDCVDERCALVEQRLKTESGGTLAALREEFGIISDLRGESSPSSLAEAQDAPRLPRQSLISPNSREDAPRRFD